MATAIDDRQRNGAVMIVERMALSDSMRLPQRAAQSLFRHWLPLLLFGVLLCALADFMNERRRPYQDQAAGRYDELPITYGSGWKLVGSQEAAQGREQFVLVGKTSESDREMYDDAIEHLCRVDEWCGIDFWSDSSLIPNHLPISDLQAAAEVANYTRNPDTGFAQLVWNCRVHRDPLNCFSYQ